MGGCAGSCPDPERSQAARVVASSSSPVVRCRQPCESSFPRLPPGGSRPQRDGSATQYLLEGAYPSGGAIACCTRRDSCSKRLLGMSGVPGAPLSAIIPLVFIHQSVISVVYGREHHCLINLRSSHRGAYGRKPLSPRTPTGALLPTLSFRKSRCEVWSMEAIPGAFSTTFASSSPGVPLSIQQSSAMGPRVGSFRNCCRSSFLSD